MKTLRLTYSVEGDAMKQLLILLLVVCVTACSTSPRGPYLFKPDYKQLWCDEIIKRASSSTSIGQWGPEDVEAAALCVREGRL